jgi:hypothetical protein
LLAAFGTRDPSFAALQNNFRVFAGRATGILQRSPVSRFTSLFIRSQQPKDFIEVALFTLT